MAASASSARGKIAALVAMRRKPSRTTQGSPIGSSPLIAASHQRNAAA